MADTTKLSIQLYTLRALGDLGKILDAVAAAGYRHVELVGGHLENPVATRAALDARGLSVSSSHVGLAALRAKPDAIVEACRVLGFAELYMPAVPPEQRDMDATGWRALGVELAALAAIMAESHIAFGYHNHDWELRPKHGTTTALELLFEATGSAPVRWQADVAWLARGGAEPKSWLTRYRDRLLSAHVKDIAPAGENADEDGWADVGAGVLDWPDLWAACRADGAGWMVVEHDKPRDPAATARASFGYIAGMAG